MRGGLDQSWSSCRALGALLDLFRIPSHAGSRGGGAASHLWRGVRRHEAGTCRKPVASNAVQSLIHTKSSCLDTSSNAP
jgi:hypothetical protein